MPGTTGDARRSDVIKHAAAPRRPLPSLGTAVVGFLTPPLFRQTARGVVHVGGGMDLDAGLVPSVEPPLLRTVTRRTTDLTAVATRLAVVGSVRALGPAMIDSFESFGFLGFLGPPGVTRPTMVVPGFAQVPGLVTVLPEAVVEFVELGQPIRGVLLLGKLPQTVEPC